MGTLQVKVSAIIPARGGSKEIPKKNLACVGGYPLIAWTILTAKRAKGLDRIIVSTDSQEIADVSTSYGAESPFLRPDELAQDDSPAEAVIHHVLDWLAEKDNYIPEYIMCLQPTSPFRNPEDIDRSIRAAVEKNADAIVSIVEADSHPYWSHELDGEGRIKPFIRLDEYVTRRQDLPSVYVENGAIVLVKRDVFLKHGSWYTERTYGYVMPQERS